MFENHRRVRQARNVTTNVPKILDLKSSSEQIFFRKLSLGAPDRIFTVECQRHPTEKGERRGSGAGASSGQRITLLAHALQRNHFVIVD